MSRPSAIGAKRAELVSVEGEAVQVPFDTHQEDAALGVLVLVGVQDVAVVPVEEIGDGGD